MKLIKTGTSSIPFTPCQETWPTTSGVHIRQLYVYNAGEREEH